MMGVEKGRRYENVGMEQTSCLASVTSNEATSLILNIAKHQNAAEISKIRADDTPFTMYGVCFVLISCKLLCMQGASLL